MSGDLSSPGQVGRSREECNPASAAQGEGPRGRIGYPSPVVFFQIIAVQLEERGGIQDLCVRVNFLEFTDDL